MLGIIVTVILIVALFVGLKKGLNTATWVLSLSVIGLLAYTLVNGTSVAGTSSGSNFFDIFELLKETIVSKFGSMLVIICAVFGYVGYMDKIGANKAFAVACAKPLMKVKNTYVLLGGTILLMCVLMFAIPAPTALVMLLFATIVPIMVEVGITKNAIASVIVMGTCIAFGPMNGQTIVTMGALGVTEPDITTFAFKYQLPIFLVMLASLCVTVAISNKFWDKKENVAKGQLETDSSAIQGAAPGYYAILAILPLILVIVFSSFVTKSISISVVAAEFASFFIAIIIDTIARKKTLKQSFDETKEFYAGMGKCIAVMGMLPIAGTLFATTLTLWGGLATVVNGLLNLGVGFVGMVIIVALLEIAICFITGDSIGTIMLVLPLVLAVLQNTTGSVLACVYVIAQFACLGSALSFIYPPTLVLSGLCDVPAASIVKRNILPTAVAGLIVLVGSLLFL